MFRKFGVADFMLHGIRLLFVAVLFAIGAFAGARTGSKSMVTGLGTVAFLLGSMGVIYLLKARIDYRAIGARYKGRTDDGLGDPVGDVQSTFDADAAFARYLERQRLGDGVANETQADTPAAPEPLRPSIQPMPPRTFGRRAV